MHYEVACDIWFTASGKAMPLKIKYKNTKEKIICIKDIAVLKDTDKMYSGIPSHEYICNGVVDNREQCFKLIFYQDKTKWIMEVID